MRERARGAPRRAGDGLELEFIESVIGNTLAGRHRRSPTRSRTGSPRPTRAPTLVPIVMPGFSDSHWFRKAFDAATVYGFCPQREMALLEAAPLIHGADERVAVADVELAAALLSPTSRRRVLG